MSVTIGTVTGIRNPELRDSVSGDPNRTFNRPLSGEHTVYATGRPFNKTYEWSLEIRQSKADEIRAFITANIGDLVTIIDQYGNSLTNCIILDPDNNYNEVSDHESDADCDFVTMTVRFIRVDA